MEVSEKLRNHTDTCVRCRRANRIGRLCSTGKRLLDTRLIELFPVLADYHDRNRRQRISRAAGESARPDAVPGD